MGILETVEQLKAARAASDMTRKDLAKEAGVSSETIKRLEGQKGKISGNITTINALSLALESKGVIFVPENGGPAGIRFRNAPAQDGIEN